MIAKDHIERVMHFQNMNSR